MTYTRNCSALNPMVDQTRSDLEILVVSLRSDFERREQLQKQFPETYPSFKFIDAYDFRNVDPGDLPDLAELRGKNVSPNLSPPEIGCALSHMKALHVATSSNAKSILILEDDVIGSDESIREILKTRDKMPPHHFLLCGGQDGLKGRHFLYANRTYNHFQLPQLVCRFLGRTCCYAVSPSMAALLHTRQQTSLQRADNWHSLLRHQTNIYFTNSLRHPLDLSSSHIEGARNSPARSSLLTRIFTDGILHTAHNQIVKASLPVLARIKGWEKAYHD